MLFPKTDGSMYEASSFGSKLSALFFRVTGKQIGVNVLRHSYISHALDKNAPHGQLTKNSKELQCRGSINVT